MRNCFSSRSPRLQESAFLICAQIFQDGCRDLRDPREGFVLDVQELHATFIRGLSILSSADVKIAALKAVINFIHCSSPEDQGRFHGLLPAMVRALMNSPDTGKTREALQLFIELARTRPSFLKPQIVMVVGSMLQIAEVGSLEEGLRHLAIEFVMTLASKAPWMVRMQSQLISRLFAILMKMVLDMEDDPMSEDEDPGDSGNCSFGQGCLDRLAILLGGYGIVPVASTYLAAPDWQKRHAALIALARIAEGSSKVAVIYLEQVVAMVLNSFQDPHPRVRWAAINAIGQWSTDFGPDLQVRYHQRVLPALSVAMDDFQNPRVQARAASAALNFIDNCTPDILSKSLVLLQGGKQMMKEGVLTSLASIAVSSQEHFQKIYDVVMPHLKLILVNATDESYRMLRAKSMECITLVGMAVGKDKFRDDAKQVIEVLMSLQGSQMEIDDPTTSYIVQAWARLCMCLGQDFLPYMSVVMPPLLQSARLKPLGVRVLLEKAIACNVLSCFANKLKEGLFPWIDQIASTLVPLLEFNSDNKWRKAAEVRKAAVSAMPGLLLSANLAIQKGPVERSGHQLAEDIVQALAKALYTECDTEIFSSIMDALKECIHLSCPLLDERLVRSISTTMQEITTMRNMMIIARDPNGVSYIPETFLFEREEEVFDQNVMGNTMEFRVSMLGYSPAQRDAMSKFDLVTELKLALSNRSVALCIPSERQVELIDIIQSALSRYAINQWPEIIKGIASSIAKEFSRHLMEVDENICSSYINDNRDKVRVGYIEGQLPAFGEEVVEAAYERMTIEADIQGISIQQGSERQIMRLLFMFLQMWPGTRLRPMGVLSNFAFRVAQLMFDMKSYICQMSPLIDIATVEAALAVYYEINAPAPAPAPALKGLGDADSGELEKGKRRRTT